MITCIDTPITSLNSKKKIYNIFKIKKDARRVDHDFSIYYDYKVFYKVKPPIKGRQNTIDHALSVKKETPCLLDETPLGANKNDYRPIINYKKDAEWLKKSQKKFHKFITKGLGNVDYLHSTLKTKSYASNGREHADGDRYIFCLDISSFFCGIDRKRVFNTLKTYLKIDNDVAYFYSGLITAPTEKGSTNFVLAQGLPSSPAVAFLCYKSLFDYINEEAKNNNITFTLYVDDMTFSSNCKIPQRFIDKVIGLLKSKKYNNNLVIKKEKTHSFKNSSTKRVTGVYIKNGEAKISRRKHYELFIIYSRLINILNDNLQSLDSYFEFYNLFLKFSGNLMHLYQVEHNGDFKKTTGNYAHDKMMNFYRNYLLMIDILPGHKYPIFVILHILPQFSEKN